MSDAVDIDRIIHMMVDGAEEGLLALAHLVAARADANVGRGDPNLDPDPSVSLHAEVVRDGLGYVIVYNEPYAAKQHEAQGYRHPRGGGAKFLERAVIEFVPKVDEIVGSRVKARVGGGPAVDLQGPGRWHG